MSLFLHERTEITAPARPPMSLLAVISFLVSVAGFITVIGFIVGPVLAHIALLRLRTGRSCGLTVRGRGLAIAALWISYVSLIVGILALLVLLITAYAALPSPNFRISAPHLF